MLPNSQLNEPAPQAGQGKKTAGVDRMIVISPKQRLILAENIKGNLKAKPYMVRYQKVFRFSAKSLNVTHPTRVWIAKPGRDEKRPLGIPTIQDRARQAVVKSALEPEWESRFEGTSYGFRPGRSAQDAIG